MAMETASSAEAAPEKESFAALLEESLGDVEVTFRQGGVVLPNLPAHLGIE